MENTEDILFWEERLGVFWDAKGWFDGDYNESQQRSSVLNKCILVLLLAHATSAPVHSSYGANAH
jgi:hypothetical protein